MFSEDERKILDPHLTNLGDVYCIQNIEPEVLAVLFAYISRSPNSLKQNILDFLEEEDLSKKDKRIKKFHEKWVLKFGHASVAEHADIKIGIENCSIVATKILEDARLGSYLEKSTRYQQFSRDSIYIDDVISKSKITDVYRKICDELFNLYETAYKSLIKYFMQESPAERQSVIQSKACDVARLILPASTTTSVGVSWNARVAEQAISKLLSSPLHEIRELGKKIKKECKKICPTLVKYAERSDYRLEMPSFIKPFVPHYAFNGKQPFCENEPEVVVLDNNGSTLDNFLTAALYSQSNLEFHAIFRSVSARTFQEKCQLIDACFGRRDYKKPPLRELEVINFGTEFIIDFGAYRDIQRHRICTQIPQDINMELGYICPSEIAAVGLTEEYHRVMERAYEAFNGIRSVLPGYEAYVVPLAFRRRVLFWWNLREVFHFIELRSGVAGHPSYRKVAIKLYNRLQELFPNIMKYCRCSIE